VAWLAAAGVLAAASLAGHWLRVSRSAPRAIAVSGTAPVPLGDSPSTPFHRGEIVFQVHCAKCHGAAGHGDPEAIGRLQPPPRDFASRPWRFEVNLETIRRVTLEGIPGTAMPAYQSALSAGDLEAVVAHTHRLATTEPLVYREASPLEAALGAAGFFPQPAFRKAPELNLVDVDGHTRSLAEEHDRMVLLYFWGTTCAHCLSSMPKLQALGETWQPRGLTVMTVCADADSAAEAQSLLDHVSPRTRAWMDESGLANLQFDVHALPTVWLIDRTGFLLASSHGMRDWESAAIDDLLRLLMSE
jgi:mono/diheme cytochrome c family protein